MPKKLNHSIVIWHVVIPGTTEQRNSGTAEQRNSGTAEHGTPEHPGTSRNTRNIEKNPEHPGTPSRKPGTPRNTPEHLPETFTYPKKARNTPPARRYYHHA